MVFCSCSAESGSCVWFAFSIVALRAESSLLKEHLETQSKELSLRKLRIEELEEKERQANENVNFWLVFVITHLIIMDWSNLLILEDIEVIVCITSHPLTYHGLDWRAYDRYCCCWRGNHKMESGSGARSCSWKSGGAGISCSGMLWMHCYILIIDTLETRFFVMRCFSSHLDCYLCEVVSLACSLWSFCIRCPPPFSEKALSLCWILWWKFFPSSFSQ